MINVTVKCFSNLSLKYLYYYFERIMFHLVFNMLAENSGTGKIYFHLDLKSNLQKKLRSTLIKMKTNLEINFENTFG